MPLDLEQFQECTLERATKYNFHLLFHHKPQSDYYSVTDNGAMYKMYAFKVTFVIQIRHIVISKRKLSPCKLLSIPYSKVFFHVHVF